MWLLVHSPRKTTDRTTTCFRLSPDGFQGSSQTLVNRLEARNDGFGPHLQKQEGREPINGVDSLRIRFTIARAQLLKVKPAAGTLAWFYFIFFASQVTQFTITTNTVKKTSKL